MHPPKTNVLHLSRYSKPQYIGQFAGLACKVIGLLRVVFHPQLEQQPLTRREFDVQNRHVHCQSDSIIVTLESLPANEHCLSTGFSIYSFLYLEDLQGGNRDVGGKGESASLSNGSITTGSRTSQGFSSKKVSADEKKVLNHTRG